MSDYAAALARYLEETDGNQAELAEKAGTTQASISRYKGSEKTRPRLPPRDIAMKIDEATAGKVPFALWTVEAARQLGIGIAA